MTGVTIGAALAHRSRTVQGRRTWGYAGPVKLERLRSAVGGGGLPVVVFTDGAAALTYYTVLALFPGIALLISALALVGGSGTADAVIDVIGDIAPPEVAEILTEPIENMSGDEVLSGTALFVSGAVALFSASRYVAAFGRTSDRIQGLAPGPGSFWRRRPLSILLVVAIIVLLPMALLAMLITGPVAVAVGDALGLSTAVRDLLGVLRWPLLAVVGVGMLAILYLSSEGMRRAGLRRVLPGAIAAIAIWLLASALFTLFIANLTAFSFTYGSLAGVVVFLIWLYVANLAALAGVAVNAARLGTLESASSGEQPDPRDPRPRLQVRSEEERA